jgi:preprotein translocase subunit SecA
MEVLKAGIGLRGYAQIDPKNEYKKEGFEKFQLLKNGIADQVTNLVFRVEIATEQMRTPQRAAPRRMALPPDPVTAQAMVEAMIAAGQAPPEVVEAVAKGARVTVRPSGSGPAARLTPPKPASAPAPRAGAPERTEAAAPRPSQPTGPQSTASQQSTPPQAAQAAQKATVQQAAAAASPSAAGGKRPGRNDPCPCGSGVKYKKCCAPAFG